MSDTTLFLGEVQFKEFEIPDSIRAGGAQSLFRHKYAGGLRTIDAMGPDDADIPWSGIFLDGTAQDRCKQLDIIRRQGKPVVLAWAGYQYLVVVASFEWDFKRTWHIPYSITLAVVQDQTQPGQSASQDVDSQTELDATDASDDADQVLQSVDEVVANSTAGPSQEDLTTIQTDASDLSISIAGIVVTINSVPSVATATVDFQNALGVQVGAAAVSSAALQLRLSTAVTQAGAPALYAGGGSPTAMAAALSNLSGLSRALASSSGCTNALGRMAKNIASLGK